MLATASANFTRAATLAVGRSLVHDNNLLHNRLTMGICMPLRLITRV